MDIKQQLLNYSYSLQCDYTVRNVEFDRFISNHINNEKKGFEKIYDAILDLRNTYKIEFIKLHTYIFYHYC